MVIYLQIRLPSTYGEYYIIIKHVIMSVNEHIRPSEADPGLTWGHRRRDGQVGLLEEKGRGTARRQTTASPHNSDLFTA
jgi:hypothetical protein